MFRLHGEFCANHPWEVIVAAFTLASCLLAIDQATVFPRVDPPESQSDLGIDTVVMTGVRCVAILYSYYKFRYLRKLGSTFLGLAGIFTVISSFIFSSSAINSLGGNMSDVRDVLFWFLLLIDLAKATRLAQFALSGGSGEEVKRNIARGLAVLGPSLTLDTIVETLLIGVGTLSGIRRLELLCSYACVSVVVNYLVFMSFYPACLSLVLELYDNINSKMPCDLNKISEDEKPNPVLQRVKIIMSGGLAVVHLHTRLAENKEDGALPLIIETHSGANQDQESPLLRVSADQLVVLILFIALTVKFAFFEDDHYEEEHVSDKPLVIPSLKKSEEQPSSTRDSEQCLSILKREQSLDSLSNQEIINLMMEGQVSAYTLEKFVFNKERAVKLRRDHLKITTRSASLDGVPYENLDYSLIFGACCENVVGYIPLPLGVAGPLLLDGEELLVPMATTEGCLVASTNRGCRAVSLNGGVISRVVEDGMTRGPVVRFKNIQQASATMHWIQEPRNFDSIKSSFDSTSRFAKLTKVQVKIAGRLLFIRFVATTGDAMGMNMVSKGTEAALEHIQRTFPDMEILSLSGNFCSDKKPAAVNWIEGRGKYVVCEATVREEHVIKVLKTTVDALVDLNINKNLVGSAVAGSIGGFNAHAANIVSAVFIATGQDPAQVVSSSNCLTLMEAHGRDLYISCTMPSIEVGTVGGGTQLPAQSSTLALLGAKGSNGTVPGQNSARLARVICGAVLAAELSLMSALASGHLVRSHLKHNRSSQCLSAKSS